MEPHPFTSGHVRELLQRINGAGGGRACRSHDEERQAAVRPIRLDPTDEIADVHPQPPVDANVAHGVAADPRLVRDLDEGMVGLGGHVEHGIAVEGAHTPFGNRRERGRQRCGHGRLVGLLPAAREVREPGGRVQLERDHQPGEHVPFDLVGDRRVWPGRQLRVVQRRKRFGDDARAPDRRVEQPEVARAVHVERPFPQQSRHVADQPVQGHRTLEVVGREALSDLGRRDPRRDGQLVERLLEVRDFLGEPPEDRIERSCGAPCLVHHRSGFVLMRKPIAPIRPAIA